MRKRNSELAKCNTGFLFWYCERTCARLL